MPFTKRSMCPELICSKHTVLVNRRRCLTTAFPSHTSPRRILFFPSASGSTLVKEQDLEIEPISCSLYVNWIEANPTFAVSIFLELLLGVRSPSLLASRTARRTRHFGGALLHCPLARLLGFSSPEVGRRSVYRCADHWSV